MLLFAILAVEIKRKAPTTHTCLEIVKARWGTTAHLVFLVFCLITNIIVTSMLILGGAWGAGQFGVLRGSIKDSGYVVSSHCMNRHRTACTVCGGALRLRRQALCLEPSQVNLLQQLLPARRQQPCADPFFLCTLSCAGPVLTLFPLHAVMCVGAAVVNALTGVNLYAAAFLIPVGVMLYTAHGGLKATFIAAWG